MRTKTQAKNRQYLKVVFDRVIEHYIAALALRGGESVAPDYGRPQARAQYKPNIRLSISDFICDVDIAARNSLSSEELTYFHLAYTSRYEKTHQEKADSYNDCDDVKSARDLRSVRERVETKLGRELKRRGIYPVKRYFTPKERV